MVNMLIFLFLFLTLQYYYVEVDISSLLLDVEIIKQEEREARPKLTMNSTFIPLGHFLFLLLSR